MKQLLNVSTESFVKVRIPDESNFKLTFKQKKIQVYKHTLVRFKKETHISYTMERFGLKDLSIPGIQELYLHKGERLHNNSSPDIKTLIMMKNVIH